MTEVIGVGAEQSNQSNQTKPHRKAAIRQTMTDSNQQASEFKVLAHSFIEQVQREAGIRLGYDLHSVQWLEAYLERLRLEAGTHQREPDWLIVVLGALLGEIIIANYGGQWQQSKEGWWGIYFDRHNAVFPFSKVAHQWANGKERDSVLALYVELPELFPFLTLKGFSRRGKGSGTSQSQPAPQ